MSRILLEKTVFDKDAFDKVINRQFSQLPPAAQADAQDAATPSFTIEDFLALFDSLYPFLTEDILRQLLERIAGTLEVRIDDTDIQALLDEITSLRQQLVEIQTTVNSVRQGSQQQ
jgi:valyl-tRNA synthetase